jgi:hypothetical protein
MGGIDEVQGGVGSAHELAAVCLIVPRVTESQEVLEALRRGLVTLEELT